MRATRSAKEGIRMAEEGQWTELVKRLPKSPALAEQQDPYGMLPLHWACTEHDISLDAIRALLGAFPEGGMTRNNSQLLPLHVAIRANARVDVLSMLCSMCPDSIWVKMPDGLRALAMATMSGLDHDSIRVLQKAEEKYRFAHPDAGDKDDADARNDPAYEATMRDLYRQSQVMRESLRDSMLFSTRFEPSFGDDTPLVPGGANEDDPSTIIQECDDDDDDSDSATASYRHASTGDSCGVCEKSFSMFRKRYMCGVCRLPLCKAHVAGRTLTPHGDRKQRVCAECLIHSRLAAKSPSLKQVPPPPPTAPASRAAKLSHDIHPKCADNQDEHVVCGFASQVPQAPGPSSPRSSGERPTMSSSDTSICSADVDDRHLLQLVKGLESRNGVLESRVLEQERQHNQAMLLLTQTMTRLAELELLVRHRALGDEFGDDEKGDDDSGAGDESTRVDRHSFESTCSMEFANPFTERFSLEVRGYVLDVRGAAGGGLANVVVASVGDPVRHRLTLHRQRLKQAVAVGDGDLHVLHAVDDESAATHVNTMLNLLRGKSSATVRPTSMSQSEKRTWTHVLSGPQSMISSRSFKEDPAFLLPMTIYFGSQTGRTEALANRLQHAAIRCGMRAKVKDLYHFDPDELNNESLAIFIVATYSGGGATDNAAHFYFWLQNQKDTRSFKKGRRLRSLRYAVFASGDTKYGINFNEFGTFVDSKLEEFGGTRLMPCCLGDCHAGLEQVFTSWEADIFQAIGLSATHSAASAKHTNSVILPPSVPHRFVIIDVVEPRAPDRRNRHLDTFVPMPDATKFFIHPNLVLNDVVYVVSEPKPAMLHVDLAMFVPPFIYTTGDRIRIYPLNPAVLVTDVATRLGFSLGQTEDRWIQPIPLTPPCEYFQDPFPSPTRLVTVPPAFVKTLACYATDANEATTLESLAADPAAFHASLSGLTLAGVLRQFPSVRMSLDAFLHTAPRMQPREFTIASSNLVNPTNIHICLDVPPAATSFQNPQRSDGMLGACFMELDVMRRKKPSSVLDPIHVPRVRSELVPPADIPWRTLGPSPVTFIATGAGFALVRALMEDRCATPVDTKVRSKHVLLYGCLTKTCVPYQNEVKFWQASLDLRVVLACSSDKVVPDADAPHRYIQDAVEAEASAILTDLDDHQGSVFVSGSVSMVADVKKILVHAKASQLKLSGADDADVSSR
ncbi:hypothetical protein DYB38_007234 [Aphanomyces astaci]|uniref:NADPH--hemoprotein reductase n=1 Tax=Aphanomyces astaci TaxID=112090 RepID=A0A397CIW0_APHAT|nr:hypothetical protein DYB38_007234 [Aphanomyces astaci]